MVSPSKVPTISQFQSFVFSVCSSPDLLVIAHGIPQLTIIATNQSVFNTVRPPLLNQCNVSVDSVQLPGPGTRRQERKIILSPNNTSVLFNSFCY